MNNRAYSITEQALSRCRWNLIPLTRRVHVTTWDMPCTTCSEHTKRPDWSCACLRGSKGAGDRIFSAWLCVWVNMLQMFFQVACSTIIGEHLLANCAGSFFLSSLKEFPHHRPLCSLKVRHDHWCANTLPVHDRTAHAVVLHNHDVGPSLRPV